MRSGSFFVAVLSIGLSAGVFAVAQTPMQARLSTHSTPVLTIDGLRFRDLNRNGLLDPYEDWRLSAAARTADLIGRMTPEEMAGVMVHGTAPSHGGSDAIGRGEEYDYVAARDLIVKHGINSMITRLSLAPSRLAEADNKLQELGEAARLGIPVTLSTDPRSHFLYVPGASVATGQFAKWPETTGFAAIGDAALVRQFADDVRQEYRAVGIREALSPQADLATEPRWARMNGTFGEDAETAKRLVEAYVVGMQAGAEGLSPESVLTVVKHWAGYGAQSHGWDSHNSYGRYATFPGNNFAYHLIPFQGAFAAHVAAVMPTYSILQGVQVDGKPLDAVGAGFSKPMLTTLLRNTFHFDGVVLSDWGITRDCNEACEHGTAPGVKPTAAEIAMPWGVESLTTEQRFARAINAGVDQVGGTEDTASILSAFHDGLLTQARMQQAAGRILLQKFQSGQFEDPFVNAAAADAIVGKPEFARLGIETQKRAMVLLENRGHLLPVAPKGKKVYLFGVERAAAQAHGLQVVMTPAEADFAIIRATSPSELLHPGYFFGSRQHEGRLDFRAGDPAYDALLSCGKTPAIVSVYLDRPAILNTMRKHAAVLLGDFGVSDDALLDVITGNGKPEGHLPFELPSSMQEVQNQREDVPHDTAHPLYPYGYALAN